MRDTVGNTVEDTVRRIVSALGLAVASGADLPAQQDAAQPAARTVRVVDPAGAPVRGATIAIVARSGADGSAPTFVTDADGRASLPDVPLRDGIAVLAPAYRLARSKPPGDGAPWTVILPRAARIEIALRGVDDPRGYHAEVRLGPEFGTRRFFQDRDATTPGRRVDSTPGHWREVFAIAPNGAMRRDGSVWSLGFTPDGRAVLDQLEDAGTATVALWRFGVEFAAREVALPASGGRFEVLFTPPPAPPPLIGVVVDATGRPLPDVSIRIAPVGGAVAIDRPHAADDGFPAWAPRETTDRHGVFRLPRPTAADERFVFRRRGHADLVLTTAELQALDGRVELAPGRVVELSALDSNGVPLDGGWSTAGRQYAEPRVHLGHDVWRGASPGDHPAAAGRAFDLPWYLFADLPAGRTRFRFRYLRDDEQLEHDTAQRIARFVAARPVETMGIGK